MLVCFFLRSLHTNRNDSSNVENRLENISSSSWCGVRTKPLPKTTQKRIMKVKIVPREQTATAGGEKIITSPDDVRQSIAEIFQFAQKSLVTHKRCTTELAALFANVGDAKQFEREFLYLLQFVLLVGKREPAVERLVEFVTKFTAKYGDGEATFNERVLGFLLAKSNCKDKAVRFRCCQLISLLMQNLSENAELRYIVLSSVYFVLSAFVHHIARVFGF